MTIAKKIFIRWGNPTDIYTGCLILLCLGFAIFFLRTYFIQDINLYLGLIIVPYVLVIDKGKHTSRFLWPFAFCLIVLFLIPAKTVFFFTALFGLLSVIEIRIGKTNPAFFWLLLVISPTCKYISSVFGMSVRLWLSEISGWILNGMGKKVEIAGNMITLDGTEFSVDPACAGLGMMLISLIIALFAISHYQRNTNRKLSGFMTILFLGLTVLLNVISNLMRIVILVLFRVMPGNPLHDIIGIVCLTVYVIITLIFACKYLFKHHGQQVMSSESDYAKAKMGFGYLALFSFLCYGGTRMPANYIRPFNSDNINLEGYTKEYLETGVLKFEKSQALVYLKPVNFYTPEHNPLICWTNSGYEFKCMNKEWINGRQICTGILQKGSDSIYTAWWFDNGKHKTVSQFDWRWKAFIGEPDFNLVNVSTTTKQELIIEIQKLFGLRGFDNHP